MGILFTVYMACSFLIIIACSEISNNKFISRFGISFVALLAMTVATIIISTTHKDFITPVIDDYENGKIIKIENVIIEDTDTIKVVEYKYK
jgi:hypothetical protein